MKKTKPYNDQGLRLALQHRNEAAEKMKPSADFADRLMQRIEEQTAKPKHRRVWLYSGIAAAAASVLLLLTLHYYNNRGGELKEMPLAETKTVAADSSSNIKNEPMPTKVVEVPLVAQAEKPKTTMTIQKTPSKSPQKYRVRKAKATQPKPTDTTEELVTHLENDELHLTAEASPQVTITRTIHLSPEQVIFIVDASNQMPAMEMLSVNELRMRGQRLTAEVQQHLQNPM